jgi:hypothetical protein
MVDAPGAGDTAHGGDLPPRLYAVYLGGDPAPGRLGEDHEVVFVVAGDTGAARRAARAKWTGADGKPHVDMVQELDAVDGYEVALTHTGRPSARSVDNTFEPSPPDDDGV